MPPADAPSLLLFGAILKLLLISLVGFGAVRLRLLDRRSIEGLSRFVLAVSLPALILTTLATELSLDRLPAMALSGLAAVGLNGLGLLLALAVRRLTLASDSPGRGLFLSLASIQNSGYLPIPLVAAALPQARETEGLLLIFVYMFVMGFLFWTLGVWLVAEEQRGRGGTLGRVVNPPLVAMLAGLLFLIPPVRYGFAALPLLPEALSLVGTTTIPLVLIILGGSFAAGVAGRPAGRRVVWLSALLRLGLIPAAVLLLLPLLPISGVAAFVLLLEAAMPAALNHIVVAREFGGDVELTSQALLVHYALSMLTVPLFLWLGQSHVAF